MINTALQRVDFNHRGTEDQEHTIKLEWLYYFVVLAETRHFSSASQKLCLTQQALSKVILQLEAQLNTRLIQRRPWQLTQRGEIFLHKAKSLLNQLARIENFGVGGSQELPNRPLQIAIEPGLETLLADFCLQLQSNLPDFHFHLQTQLKTSEDALLNGTIDLLMQLTPPIQNRFLAYENCFTSEMVFVAGPDFELRQAHYPLIEFREAFRQFPAIPPHIPLRSAIQASLPVAIELAKASLGVLWIPESLIQNELQRKELKQLQVKGQPFTMVNYQAVYHPQSCLKRPALQYLLTALKQLTYQDMYNSLNSQPNHFPWPDR